MTDKKRKINTERVPKARGSIRCSSWCGFGCTDAAYAQAVLEAEALAGRLGGGWRPVVWENAGWHYKAIRGVGEVSPHVRGSALHGGWEVVGYSAWLQSGVSQVIAQGETPEEALDCMTREALARLGRVTSDLATVLA